MRIPITDISIPELSVYMQRNEPQLFHWNEPEAGIFICESPNVILRALNAGYEPLSLLTEDKYLHGADDDKNESVRSACEILARIEGMDAVSVYTAPFELLRDLTGYSLTHGMLCAMRRKPLPEPEELCAGKHRIAVLEGVTNPTNVGAIFRSAAALFAEAVLLSEDCADPLYRRAARVSMGTVFQLPWTKMKTPDSVELLHRIGFRTAALALSDTAISVDDAAPLREKRLAVLLGSEGYGLTEETIEKSDYVVKIPMADGVDSLNVAAASAVAFWQLCGKEHYVKNSGKG